jgi:transcriptional regulator with XRE-family HTH domain
MVELGKKLRTLRAEKGYTQEKIADMLGIPQATYSNLENNKGKVDLKLLEKVANVFEIDMVELLKTESLIFYNQENSGGQNGLIINQLSEKLIEQYEERIKELKEIIALLKTK